MICRVNSGKGCERDRRARVFQPERALPKGQPCEVNNVARSLYMYRISLTLIASAAPTLVTYTASLDCVQAIGKSSITG